MTKSWLGRYLLITCGFFVAGWHACLWLRPVPTYAITPDDCKQVGMKATGWTVHEEYKGGINNGGVSGFIKYECK